MGNILQKIHWLIIAGALFNITTYYLDVNEQLSGIVAQQDIQTQSYQKGLKTKKELALFFKDINEAKARIERVAQEIEKTQQLLPSTISDTDNIGLLRKIAEDVNIKEVSINPAEDDDRGFFIARKYKFKAKATYLQFLIMFEKISNHKRILNISQLAFNKLDEPQRSKFQLINGEFILEAYRFNPQYTEDRGIDRIEKAFTDQPPKAKIPAKKKENN